MMETIEVEKKLKEFEVIVEEEAIFYSFKEYGGVAYASWFRRLKAFEVFLPLEMSFADRAERRWCDRYL